MEPLTEAQQELLDWLTEYIRTHQHSPSIREMMKAMNLRSPAPVQSRLEHLKSKGYIDWIEGQARTIRLLHPMGRGIPIKGAIAAGQMVEAFADTADVERLDLTNLPLKPQDFALRVRGDSMIDALIDNGDVVIMRPVADPKTVKNGTIVAARVDGTTTLKYFHRKNKMVVLQPANPSYAPIEMPAAEVEVQGVLVGVWRYSGL